MHSLAPYTNYFGDVPLIDSVLFAHRVLFSQLFLLSFLCISFQTVLVILSTLILPYWIQIINLIQPVLTWIENSNSCHALFYTYQDIYFVATDPLCSSTWNRIANLVFLFVYFLVAIPSLRNCTCSKDDLNDLKHLVKHSVKSVFGSSSFSAKSSRTSSLSLTLRKMTKFFSGFRCP